MLGYGSNVMQPGYTRPAVSMMSPMSTSSGSYPKSSGSYPKKSSGTGLLSSMPGAKSSGFPKFSSSSMPKPATISGPSAASVNTNLNIPPPQQYNPQTYNDPNLDYMAQQSKGLMDPDSDYYKRLSAGMQGQIGAQSAAQERGAAMRGAWSGLGGGQGAEVMQTAADIGQSGLEAQGSAEADLRLAAPQLGMQGLQSTFNPRLGYNQMAQGDRQFGAGMGENQRQFGSNIGLAQQQMAAQQAQAQQQIGMQADIFNAQSQNQFAMQNQQNQYNLMLQQMAQQYA